MFSRLGALHGNKAFLGKRPWEEGLCLPRGKVEKGLRAVSQNGAAHACSVGGGLRDTDVLVKICQKVGMRECAQPWAASRTCREGFPEVEVIFEVKGLAFGKVSFGKQLSWKRMSLCGSSSEGFLTQHQLGVSDRLFRVLISPVPEAFSSAGFQCPLCCCCAADPVGCSARLLGLL